MKKATTILEKVTTISILIVVLVIVYCVTMLTNNYRWQKSYSSFDASQALQLSKTNEKFVGNARVEKQVLDVLTKVKVAAEKGYTSVNYYYATNPESWEETKTILRKKNFKIGSDFRPETANGEFDLIYWGAGVTDNYGK